MKIEVGLCRTGDEVFVRTDGFTHLIAMRQTANEAVFATTAIPEWFSNLWHAQNQMMRTLGFTMRKTRLGWELQWRNRGFSSAEPEPLGCGNTSEESDFHNWLREVSESMPMPVPQGVA